MDLEEIRQFCLSFSDVEESFPFDDTTLVFKTNKKIFALLNLSSEPSINLKCDPELAVDLREQYSFIIPGYHMNKKHWNTLLLKECVFEKIIRDLIDHSYNLVSKKKIR